MDDEKCAKNTKNIPLCAFALSPRFKIRTCDHFGDTKKTRNFSVKKIAHCLYKTRKNNRRFRGDKRSTPIFLKCVTGVVKNRRLPQRQKFELEKVISVVKNVWNTPDTNKSPITKSPSEMSEYLKKNTSDVSSDISSPVLLRRRLSAPETIMRRHMLAHQRSDSQASSDVTQTSDVNRSYQWRGDLSTGSDPNLNRRRDLGLMRKSTLLRRMWSNSRPVLEQRNSTSSTAYYDWQQHSFSRLSTTGRSTQSLLSNHSSPEHLSRRSLNGDDFREVKMKKAKRLSASDKVFLSPSSSSSSSKNDNGNSNTNSFCSNCNNNVINSSTKETTILSDTKISTTTITPKTTETENESFPTYTSRSTGTSTFSDNSDSAFINSKSNFTQSSNGNSRSTPYYSDIQKHINEESEKSNENINNNNNMNTSYKHDDTNESSTQTVETTNLNVISNVQLSESTLDLIFNKVMQDIKNTLPSGLNINTLSTTVSAKGCEEKVDDNSKIIQVKETPCFYLKRKEEITFNPEHKRIVKYMISNVGTGSPYCKPAEVPQVIVPRFSALPRTSSMEVNTSSAESTDKESDSVSLVDSLEDPSSPRIDPNQINSHDDKPVRGDLSLLLPDNSNKKKNKKKTTTAAFFIPIEKTDRPDVKPVSELLPDKVREKLSKRQTQREMKMQQMKNKSNSTKSDSNYMSASENGNINFTTTENASEYNLNASCNTIRHEITHGKTKKRTKTILPTIETVRKIKIENTKRGNNRKCPQLENVKTKKTGSSKVQQKIPEKLSPIYTSKNEYVYDTGPNRRIYHKTELSNSGKRIEILEIMECVDESNGRCSRAQKNRSKIPVPVQQKLPKIPTVSERKYNPTYLDFEEVHVDDPKIDQLIANILIDALNKTDQFQQSPKSFAKMNEKRPCAAHPQSKYTQKFAVIPEELSQQNSTEEQQKTPKENCNSTTKQTGTGGDSLKKTQPYKGKAALAVIKDDNFSSIPKGWITFYTLNKNQGSPDSTSDEGGKNLRHGADRNNNGPENELDKTNDCCNGEKELFSSIKDTGNFLSSSSSSETDKIVQGRHKKYTPRKGRSKNSSLYNRGWSVTVSGVNTCGEFGPDLEMRLKFPQKSKQNQNQSDSGLGEEHPQSKKSDLPYIDVKKYERGASSNEDGKYENSFREKLPDINKNVKLTQSSQNCTPDHFKSRLISSIEPRQTKTSARRFSLHKPKCEKFPVDERQFREVLLCLPHILSITGNSISPERKPKVPTMSERDLTRHICANQH